jgi:hypothetical protein
MSVDVIPYRDQRVVARTECRSVENRSHLVADGHNNRSV